MSTSLGLFASPPLILSTESVVVMEWKGVSTSTAASTEVYQERPPGLQSPCSCRPFHSMTTTDSVKRISNGLAKSLSEVLKPPTSSPIHVVLRQQPCACVSRPLRDVMHRGTRGKPPWHAARSFRGGRRPVELPFAPDPGCTARPRACGSKYHLYPSSWVRAFPVSR